MLHPSLYHYQSDLYLDSPQSYIHLKPKGSTLVDEI